MAMSDQYQQTLDWLFSQLPMFHRIGAAAYKANLDNTYALMEICGNPEKELVCLHVAGTNGKGSSSHMLASVFQAHGYKTGLYTSPHLVDFRERIRLNGAMIPASYVVEFVEKYKVKVESIQPSFFEWTVALAFDYFRSEKVDIAIIETGLGGRLDSTNVIHPELSLITNISMDHAALLGDTLAKIAGEKAGIIKPATPVVISEHSSIDFVFREKAEQEQAPIRFAGDCVEVLKTEVPASFKVTVADDSYWQNKVVKLDLQGAYQQKNLSGVLCALFMLKDKWKLQDDKIVAGISNAASNTGLQGRWMCLQQSPYVVADIAHNEAGIQELVQSLKGYTYKNLHIVFGAVQDKEVAKVLQLLPATAHFHCCAPRLPRALPVSQLMEKVVMAGREGQAYETVEAAYQGALACAGSDDFILICGSNFVVAEVLASLTHD